MSDAPAREVRSSVILYAAIENGSEPVECRVRNLSASGACVDNLAGVIAGDIVTVRMGALRPLSAEVKWANPRLAGLHFDKLIDLAVARQPRPRITPSAPPAPATARPAVAASAGWMQHIHNPYRRT